MESSSSSDNSGEDERGAPEDGRQQYANKCELLLSLIGYAVGLGNVWRFPSLAFENGGAAFLIPYFASLCLLGLPLFILELGLGQVYRQGTLGIWKKMGLPKLQGLGIMATLCTWFVSLYYVVIMAWTFYYIFRTAKALPSGILPWTEQGTSFNCPRMDYYINDTAVGQTDLFHNSTGLYNSKYQADFFCDKSYAWCRSTESEECKSIKAEGQCNSLKACHWQPPPGYSNKSAAVTSCPANAAVAFWEEQVLQQSSGMDDLGGFNIGLLVSFTLMWILTYLIIFQGVASSGKVVYVTAMLPYFALAAFLIRALTLPNASAGVRFFLVPDFSKLLDPVVWLRAVNQIFYSLGVGFGTLIAFASYSDKHDDFVGNAVKVSCINCGTSVLAGFVVFPILGYLAHEMSKMDPCITGRDVGQLQDIGLSGTGLAFVAFPIAMSRMPVPFFWALVFFVMLLCLGIDSQFAMVESVMTVIHDSGIARNMPKPALAAIVCLVSWACGLIFVTKGGIYWFNTFDYYTCVIAMFCVTTGECLGLMWVSKDTWKHFTSKVYEFTDISMGKVYRIFWKFVDPLLLCGLCISAFMSFDIMKARSSKPYPEGAGYLPEWSIYLGWKLALLPLIAGWVAFIFIPSADEAQDDEDGEHG